MNLEHLALVGAAVCAAIVIIVFYAFVATGLGAWLLGV